MIILKFRRCQRKFTLSTARENSCVVATSWTSHVATIKEVRADVESIDPCDGWYTCDGLAVLDYTGPRRNNEAVDVQTECCLLQAWQPTVVSVLRQRPSEHLSSANSWRLLRRQASHPGPQGGKKTLARDTKSHLSPRIMHKVQERLSHSAVEYAVFDFPSSTLPLWRQKVRA